jgi:hypothetical protein
MMVVIALHALYVVDFFVNEEWQVWFKLAFSHG